jgi:predicted Zn-dependent protease
MNRLAAGFTPATSAILLFALLMFLEATGVALAGAPGEARDITVADRAMRLARAGHTEEALQLLQADLAARPADIDARMALGELYTSHGQGDMAAQQFREVLRLRPASSPAALALAQLYISGGDLNNAEHVLADAVRLNPRSAQVHMLLAFIFARQHKYAEAQANIRLVPPPTDASERVRYFRLVAAIYSGLGDLHAAAHTAEQALHAKPEDKDLALMAAVAEEEAGEWEACKRNALPLFAAHPTAASGLLVLQAQLSTHADFSSTLQTLGSLQLTDDQKMELHIRAANMLSAGGYHAKAVGELQSAFKTAEQDEGLRYKLAVEQYRAGQLDPALSTIAGLRSQKDSAEIENLAGDIEEGRGDSVASVHAYQKAIDLNPHEEQYWLSLGGELLKYQTYEPALLLFQQAAKLFPQSPRVYLGLGMAAYFRDQFDDSASALLHANELEPQSELAVSYLGVTQTHRPDGPNPAAVAAICSSADSSAARPVASSWCGALLFQSAYLANNQSKAQQAIRRLRVAATLSPSDPVAICSLGEALAWSEEWTAARTQLEHCVRMLPNSALDHYKLSHVYRKLGLTQAAQAEADLTKKATGETNQRDDLSKKFVYEVPGKSAELPGPK